MLVDRSNDFVIEAREHLAIIEESLLALERQSEAEEFTVKLDRCFRSIHSIKGDAGFLGLQPIRELAHAMETLLSEIRNGVPSRTIESLLVARDRLAVLVDDLANSHLIEIGDILERLQASETDPLIIGARGVEDAQPGLLNLNPENVVGNRAGHEVPIRTGTVILDVNLTEWNGVHSGGVAALIRQIAAVGRVNEGFVLFAACDLRNGLPQAPVHWKACVETSRSLEELRAIAGQSQQRGPKQPVSLRIELTKWLRQTGNSGLASLFSKLTSAVEIMSGKVLFPAVDLRLTLPNNPIEWTGECRTSLTTEDLVQRYGAEALSEVPSPFHNDSIPAVTAKPGGDTSRGEAPGRLRPNSAAVPPDGEKSSTLRIQVELLDRLMTLVGELTLVRNQSLLAFADHDGPRRAIIQRLNSVTSELQDATLRARMQPVGNLFNRFPRMVRDLARQLGKQVEIEVRGSDVEVDKTILEQLSDPLTHLVRNSVDHGLELPEERVAKGKPSVGKITLSATHDDGQVHIQISDDGKGIDPEAVKSKALLLRLKTEAELERMSPRELYSLILLPGFSTAKKVTEVSGRGVGMDVVQTNIEQLEGTLNIDSVAGLGCSMVLRLPLTLAIIPCLIVHVNGDRFAVPQRDLEEVVCLHPQAPGRIEQAFDTEVYRLRNRLLPIIRLSDILNRRRPFTPDVKAEILAANSTVCSPTRIEYILVLKLSGKRFGLVVDDVGSMEEIVVKPMHPSMKRVRIFTGATIMGDGRAALITDVQGIVEHARLSFESIQETESKSNTRDAAQTHRVLLFESGPHEQFALPLLQIRRIELIDHGRIERVGENEYVTVDGVSTRILRLDKVVNVSAQESVPSGGQLSLLLPKFVPQAVGIIVSRIVDTESLAVELQQHPEQDPEILGSAIVRGRLTLFLDMHRLTQKFFGTPEFVHTVPSSSAKHRKRLLLVDDTAFFREVVKRYLVAEGLEVDTAIHGADGLAKIASGGVFDLIVSDIEMPVMDGWEFAREARRRGVTTPMLALTSLSGEQYESKARECGYDGYETKLDHSRLLRKVGALLSEKETS